MIVIFSKAIHSGKTTALENSFTGKNNIGGILMPDIDGSRKLMNIATKEVFEIECTAPAEPESLVIIGKYRFYKNAFDKGNSILLQALQVKCQWLIIDELGKLELNGAGFYPGIKKVIDEHDARIFPGNIILVIRDTLLEQAVQFFNIKDHKLINDTDELDLTARSY